MDRQKLADLYSSSWEYSNNLKDKYSRNRLFAAIQNDVMIPHVSHYLYESGFRPHYPENKKFAVCISHDVDYMFHGYTVRLRNLADALRHVNFPETFNSASYLVKRRIHQELQLENLIEIHRKHRIRSSYYFLSLRPGEEDFNYKLEEVKDQIALVAANNNEIGLHGGHQAYNNPEKIADERNYLQSVAGKSITGYRNHALRFDTPTTWNFLSQCGFKYDTTFGYPDCVGFRNGMCYPFYPVNPLTGERIKIIEVPLIAMDATFFNYMKTDERQSLEICKIIINRVRDCGGVFTLLWHNNFVTGGFETLYRNILDYISSQNPWITTTGEVADWWESEKLLEKSTSLLNSLSSEIRKN